MLFPPSISPPLFLSVVIKEMALKPNVGSDRSWVYTAHDYSEGEPTTELLAVRFANSENAQEFKAKFEQAQKINTELSSGPALKEKKEEEEKRSSEEKAESKAEETKKDKEEEEKKNEDGTKE